MKANELRIGNLNEYDNVGEWLRNTIDWQELQWISDDEDGYNKAHRPIPLTEEWLERFGFELNSDWDSYIKTYSSSRNSVMRFIIRRDLVVCDMAYEPKVEHVHQLQNLYFALTGEELKEKL